MIKPNEQAAREYSNNEAKILPGMFDHGEARKAHLSGQQHVIETLKEMARGHEKEIDAEAIKSATIDGKFIVGFDWQFTQGAHFGFTLGQASMQRDKEQWERQWHDEVTANAAGYNEAHAKFQSQLTQRDSTIKSLTEMVEVMEKALDFYASSLNWERDSGNDWVQNASISIKGDYLKMSKRVIGGKRARQALTKISELRKKDGV